MTIHGPSNPNSDVSRMYTEQKKEESAVKILSKAREGT